MNKKKTSYNYALQPAPRLGEMNIFALSSLIASFVILLVGQAALMRNHRSPLNRIFFLFSLTGAYGAFTEFGYRIAESYTLAQFWLRASFMWNFTLPLELHFVVLLSGNKKIFKNKLLLVLLYGFPAVFSILSWFDPAMFEPVKVPWGWTYSVPPNSLKYLLYDSWVVGIALLTLWICILNIGRAQNYVKKRQAQLVLAGVLASTIFGGAELFLPYYGIRIPEVSTIAFALEFGILLYAMVRYELFALTATAAADTILATLTDILILADSDGEIVTINEAAEEMLGFGQSELIGHQVGQMMGKNERVHFERILDQELSAKGEIRDAEVSFVTKDERLIPVSISASVVEENHQLRGIVYLARDLTNRKNNEILLKTALEQKDVLLKEVHHRVKNNLQIVSSLLLLQQRRTKDERVSEALNENRNRIHTMAMVYELLYQANNLAEIDISKYIDWVSSNLFASLDEEDQKGKAIRTEIEEVYLSLDATLNCGLIINELVSNSLKYAYPDGRSGETKIGLSAGTDGRITLQVSDNGIGLPPQLDPNETDTLGLQLVMMLTHELGGTLEVSRNGGTSFKISFEQ